jgi:hypothetical protein
MDKREGRIMSGHDDFAFEPVPGLPAAPPKGEVILWQGRPDTMALARQAYGLGWVALYFAGLILWRASIGFDLAGVKGALAYGLPYVGVGALGCGLVLLLAWVQAKATVYTVTSARVAMRIGAALTVTLNLPYPQLSSANLALGKGGNGTIALQMQGDNRISYLVCWPHVRPWRMGRTEPALRCIPDASRVAKLLAEAAETRLTQPVVSRRSDVTLASVAAE